jgi:hypothetical protein
MPKHITALDVLHEARRARRILNRLIRYLDQQERAERRQGDKRRAAFESKRNAATPDELAEQP